MVDVGVENGTSRIILQQHAVNVTGQSSPVVDMPEVSSYFRSTSISINLPVTRLGRPNLRVGQRIDGHWVAGCCPSELRAILIECVNAAADGEHCENVSQLQLSFLFFFSHQMASYDDVSRDDMSNVVDFNDNSNDVIQGTMTSQQVTRQ